MKQLFCIIVLLIFLRACVGETVRIQDESMAPYFFKGDTVFISKMHYGLRSPGSGSHIISWRKIKTGDLVLIQKFARPQLLALRRVIAVPGESIKLEKGTIYKKNRGGEWKLISCNPNNAQGLCREKLGEKEFLRLQSQASPSQNLSQDRSYSPLGENEVFVAADARGAALDSRSFGPIRLQEIVGRASYIFLPVENKWIQEQNKVIVEEIGRRKFFSVVP